MAGNCLTLKKSGLRRWLSRPALLVSTLSVLMFSVNDDLAGSLESIVKLPVKLSNRPWT